MEVQAESVREAYIQGVLARGDRRLGAVLLAAQARGGARGWRQALKEAEIAEDFYLYRPRALGEVQPWQHLDMGLAAGYLESEWQSAGRQQPTPACIEGCTRCGVCGEREDRHEKV